MIDIRLATTDIELDKIYRFRYKVYIDEMRRIQKFANHHTKKIVEPLDSTAYIYGAWLGEEVIGTIRVNLSSESDLGLYEDLYCMHLVGEFHPRKTSITTKLMVASEHRRSAVGIGLLTAAHRLGLTKGVEFDFADCNRHLEPVSLKMGYRFYKDRIDHPEYGDVAPMILVLRDRAHLESLRSPFLHACYDFKGDSSASEFFYRNICTLEEKTVAVAHSDETGIYKGVSLG